ncbi:MAG: PP2C family protein-serine/threonine phosphatase [Fibrobacterota bacterium]
MTDKRAKDIIDELQHENARLQQEVMSNELTSHFSELLHGVESVEEVLKILLSSISEIVSFRRIIYFALDHENYRLEARYLEGFTQSNRRKLKDLTFFLDDCDHNIFRAVFQGVQINVQDGLAEENQLSQILSCDNYVLVPLMRRRTSPDIAGEIDSSATKGSERERRYRTAVRTPDFPTLGLFWFDADRIDDSSLAQDMANLSEFIPTASLTLDNITMISRLKEINRSNRIELQRAQKVQQALLPKTLPDTPTIRAAAHYTPEEEIGGDYYDLFPLSATQYGVIIADVSGHGPSSALVMGMLKVLLRQYADPRTHPAEVFERINEILVKYVPAGKFITSFYAVIDTEKKTIAHSSAGHCPVYRINRGTRSLQELKSDGIFIGMFPDFTLPRTSLSYDTEESRLVLYTDGITEAANREGKQFGNTRLKKAVQESMNLSHREAVEFILKKVRSFIGAVPLDDDITLLIVDL